MPDGNNWKTKFVFIESIKELNSYNRLVLKKQKKYFYYIANNICKINHYIGKSFEEYIIKTLKFEGNIKGNLYSDYWDKIYKENKELIDNPRDLYKLYFIDNINNIK